MMKVPSLLVMEIIKIAFCIGNVLLFEDPKTQSRVLVVNKGSGRKKEMYVIKDDSEFNTRPSEHPQ